MKPLSIKLVALGGILAAWSVAQEPSPPPAPSVEGPRASKAQVDPALSALIDFTAASTSDAASTTARRLIALFDVGRMTCELVEATGLPEKRVEGIARSLRQARVAPSRGTLKTVYAPERGLMLVIGRNDSARVTKLGEAGLQQLVRVEQAAVENASESLPAEAREAFERYWAAKRAAAALLAKTVPFVDQLRTQATIDVEGAPHYVLDRNGRGVPLSRSRVDASDAPLDEDRIAPNAVEGHAAAPRAPGADSMSGADLHEALRAMERARTEAVLGADRLDRLNQLRAQLSDESLAAPQRPAQETDLAARKALLDAHRAVLEADKTRALSEKAKLEAAALDMSGDLRSLSDELVLQQVQGLRASAAELSRRAESDRAREFDRSVRSDPRGAAATTVDRNRAEIESLRAEIRAMRQELESLKNPPR